MTEKSITKLENLSNEIFFDIFEYIYHDQLFHAVNGLNYRINSIIKDYRLLSNLVFVRMIDIQSVMDSNPIRNVYLRTSNTSILSTSSFFLCSAMPHARRLSINQIYLPDLIVGLRCLTYKMPYLIHVAISLNNATVPSSCNIVYLLEGFLNLCHIRTLLLKLWYCPKEIVCTRLLQEKRAPFLEHLSISRCRFSLISLIDLTKRLPSLNSLQMNIQRNNECPDFSVFQQLNKATFKLIGFDQDNLRNFFSSMTRLRSLRLENEVFISMARLYVPSTTRISCTPVNYFIPPY